MISWAAQCSRRSGWYRLYFLQRLLLTGNRKILGGCHVDPLFLSSRRGADWGGNERF
jgi:hypothetical protein